MRSTDHAVAVMAFTVVLSGCGAGPGGAGVGSAVTVTGAQERITGYLLDTLRALPVGAGLSRIPDDPALGAFDDNDAAITVPCEDTDTVTDGPEQVQIVYWVVGIEGHNARSFGLIRDAWTHRGWRLAADSTSRWASVRTPEGYSLTVQRAGRGAGAVSITVGSPCFPIPAQHVRLRQPAVLHRPSR